MPIMVTLTFASTYEAALAAVDAHPEMIEPFFASATKYRMKNHGHLLGDGKFVGLTEFPTREDFANFQVETSDFSAMIDRELGITTQTEIWEFDPPRQH